MIPLLGPLVTAKFSDYNWMLDTASPNGELPSRRSSEPPHSKRTGIEEFRR